MAQPYATAAPSAPTNPTNLVTQVQLSISCKGLINKDTFSKSDPLAVVHLFSGNQWIEVGRTEQIKDNLNPNFAKSIIVDYHFEELQKLKFSVYDIDDPKENLSKADFLGNLETTLGQLVSSQKYSKPLQLPKTTNAGTITIAAEELATNHDLVDFTFRATKLDKKDFFGKSDPYLEFSKAKEDGSFVVFHRTEVVKNTLNPSWKPFQLSVVNLCNADLNRTIKVDCYDWDSDGSNDFIGQFTTNLNEMEKAGKPHEISWPCINPKKMSKKKNYNNSGIIYLSRCEILKRYSFLDFISAGLQLNFSVAIDFTASNGHPAQNTSLHYINPYQPNEYLKALTAVGQIIQDYDRDNLYPCYGFGAKLPPNNQVSHMFALNFNPQNPYCAGIQGIVQAYQSCLPSVTLYGPTNVSPVINHVASFARQSVAAESYHILLILTDGVISDMDQTKTAIVEASSLPMSIIIVGVGAADFDMMEELDADDNLLTSPSGKRAQRDIVQFVPFRDFQNSSPAALAKCVLAEVPEQVTGYFGSRHIAPTPRR
ncbi:copine-3-like isoform X2 [Dendronephthya gigantea]|uniref:copine-3-like isoform X2 n=1 Tax=Dendronephthya gigantea TaxID=151771 RepID=UPI00106BA66F|nr:copine-3-like isoform X2 [Dendronephthya gigantea]